MKEDQDDWIHNPDNGPLCDHCGLRIPQFEHISEREFERVRELMRQSRTPQAVRELQALAGCPRPWAVLWVEHNGRPIPKAGGGQCPYCRAALRTSLAKQCLQCGMDWHDEAGPRKLGN